MNVALINSGFGTLRDVLLFVGGGAGFFYQLVTQAPKDYNSFTIILCAALMGSPYVKPYFRAIFKEEEDKSK